MIVSYEHEWSHTHMALGMRTALGWFAVYRILSVSIAHRTHRTLLYMYCSTSGLSIIPLPAPLLGNVLVVSSLEHLDGHAHLNPALQVVGCTRLGEKRRDLHPKTALELRAFVHVSVLSEGPVWFHWMAMASVLVDIGQFAAGGGVSGCQGGIRGGYSPDCPTRDVEFGGVALAARPWPESDLLPRLFIVGRFTIAHYPRMSVSHCGAK